jgi:magnesium transporter
MIRTLYRPRGGRPRFDLSPGEVPAALADPEGLLWMDFQAEPPEVCEPILRQTFGFHPLAVDDALQESHVPKIDDWGQYLYLVLPAILLETSSEPHIEIQELDAFLGPNYLVTHHDHHVAVVDRVWSSCQRDERHLEGDVDHVLYRLVDELAASYMAVIERLDDAIEVVEDEVFDRPTTSTLERIFVLKRALIQLRRIIVPQREVLNRLARGDYAVIDAHDRVFFRDVYDHLVRMHDINESMRDLVAGALDTYLSVINNRMNDIMKTLTIITTLFMPLSFLTGFFGMNFFGPSARLEAWTGLPALVITLAILIATPLGMYLWMQRQGWSRGWGASPRR